MGAVAGAARRYAGPGGAFQARSRCRDLRLNQAPLEAPPRLYVLGLPPRWLSGEGLGDYWFSERERETLSTEFPVRSGIALRQERLAALQAWVAGAGEVHFLDAAYDSDGRERETIDPALRELAEGLGLDAATVPEQPAEMGAHPSRVRSFSALRPLSALSVRLPRLPLAPGGRRPRLRRPRSTATRAVVFNPWPITAGGSRTSRIRTRICGPRRAVIFACGRQDLARIRAEDGSFAVSSASALEQAWKLEAPRGLIRTQRTERYVRGRMSQVLEAFLEKEREYFTRAPSKIASLDSAYFSLKYDDVAIIGTPDRIDEHPDGLFVMDYKTSSALPNGSDILEQGYRLQLPFYALAARASLRKPVLGVQFVELNKKGGRGAGIFFTRYNGKEPGKLTTLTARSKSLLAIEPDEAWARLEESVHAQALGFVEGRFEAFPKKEKECTTCMVADFCGFKRLTERPTREQLDAQVLPERPSQVPAAEPVADPLAPEQPRAVPEPAAPLELT